MSGRSVPFNQKHPPHDHPEHQAPDRHQVANEDSTASHPSSSKPDPTTSVPQSRFNPPETSSRDTHDATQGGFPAAASSGPTKQSGSQVAELESLRGMLRKGLRQFRDFPSPGILFEDIMPIFSQHHLHASLIRALELEFANVFRTTAGKKRKIDVIVGLESRGFLFGPTLALRLGAGFVPVRKKSKLPGPCATETFKKEYGEDVFQMQSDAVRSGQTVVIVDDIIATGGSASAAGKLVRKLGGVLLGYVFMMELDFLKGREKLDAPAYTLLSGQEEKMDSGLPLGRTKESAQEAARPVMDAGGSAAKQRP